MPSKNRRSNAVIKAREFISEHIARGTFDQDGRLPPIRQLAAQAGVSLVTMFKAITLLKSEGILEGAAGHRPRVHRETPPPSGTPEGSEPLYTSRAQRISALIEHDILNGRYPPSAKLPSFKELGARYHVSYSTIKKALDRLVAERIIVCSGRGYAAAALATASHLSGRIVIMGFGVNPDKLITGSLDIELLRFLENECARSHVGLDTVVYTLDGDSIRYTKVGTAVPYDLDDNENVFGYIILIVNYRSVREDMFRRVAATGKPVVIHDEFGGWTLPRALHKSKNIRFISSATANKGISGVARKLLSLGHNRIAYISTFNTEPWVLRRLQCIRETYAAAGNATGVVECMLDEAPRMWKYYQDARAHTGVDSLITFYNEWKKNVPYEFLHTMDPAFERLSYIICARGELYLGLSKMFEKLLSDKGITAWVGANDFSALLAMDFLQKKNVRIPDDMSVIGFDDSETAMNACLTSYNFNMHAAALTMLRLILSPSSAGSLQRRKRFEIEGHLIERATLARASR